MLLSHFLFSRTYVIQAKEFLSYLSREWSSPEKIDAHLVNVEV